MIAALRLVYDALIWLAVACVLVPVEWARIALGASSRRDLAERLARAAPPRRQPGPRFLVHAVSVGETAAAAPFLAAVLERRPDARFALTAGNRDGREAAERLGARVPAVESVGLMPWDRRGALLRWLAALAPDAVVVVETEIWPNLFRACRDLGVPLFVVNGRMARGDVARYRLARPFFADVLAAPRWIGVVDAAAAEAFRRIGADPARVEVVGNLKLDALPDGDELAAPWRDAVAAPGRPPLIAAASTHRPEERLLLDALVAVRDRVPGTRILIAPRRPRRCAAVARLAAARGLAVARWSAPEAAATAWDVLLVDRIGPLAAALSRADVVFVGGTLAPRGGHTPLEAAARGRPIVTGPSVAHFEDAVRALAAAGALVALPEGGRAERPLADALARILGDPAEREAMGRRALEFVAARRGVAPRCADAVLSRADEAARGRRPTLSALVLARDEERRIAECLRSLAFADQVVVVDDGSADRTAEVARGCGAVVLSRRLDTFAAQRNFALAACTGEWVLWVDADERVSDELRAEVERRLRDPGGAAGFRVPIRSFFLGRWVRGCGWYPNRRVRVFRRAGAAFSGAGFETLSLAGAVATLRSPLLHEPYADLAHFARKIDFYSTLAAAERRRAGGRAHPHDLLLRPAARFLKHYVLQHGFLDGAPGLVVSAMSAAYAFMKYAKLAELQRRAGR